MPFSATVLSWLVLAALVLAGLAFLAALAALRRAGIRRGRGPRPVRRRPQALPRGKTTPLSSDEVSAEIHRLRRDVSTTLRHMAVVRYDDGIGHPFWFRREVFADLAALHGDKAVWKLLESGRHPVTEVRVAGPVPLDVDSEEDYQAHHAGERVP